MKNLFNFSFLSFLVFTLFSCEKIDSELVFPENLETINLHDGDIDYENPMKVIVFLDRSLTGYYPLEPIFKWDETFNEKNPDVQVVVYLGNVFPEEKVQEKLDKLKFNYPVILDPQNLFYQSNNLDTIPWDNKRILGLLVRDKKVIDYAEVWISELIQRQIAKEKRMVGK